MKKNLKTNNKKKSYKLEVSPDFYNKLAVYAVTNDMHINTIYQLCKVPSMSQMINTMEEEVIEQYEMHKPTIDILRDKDKRDEVNRIMEQKGIKIRIPNY